MFGNGIEGHGGIRIACVCVTGEYTGDGSTSQSIDTGVTGQVKNVFISVKNSSSGVSVETFETNDVIVDDNGNGFALTPSSINLVMNGFSNQIIALNSDGTFVVDDAGTDAHPNKLSTVYNYIAFVEVLA